MARSRSGVDRPATQLGTAVMSVISLAIAQSDGLDVVTPSDRTHYFASLSDENQIFANLLEYKPASAAPSSPWCNPDILIL
jgi:hypothetical protein